MQQRPVVPGEARRGMCSRPQILQVAPSAALSYEFSKTLEGLNEESRGRGRGAGRRRQETKRDNYSFARRRWNACGEPVFSSSLPLPSSVSSVFLLCLTFKGREVRMCYFTARALASVSVCVSANTH